MRSANLKSIKHNSECQAEYDESGTDRLCPLGKCPNQLNTDERVLSALRLFDKSIIQSDITRVSLSSLNTPLSFKMYFPRIIEELLSQF